MVSKINTNPVVGDVYLTAPETSVNRDRHGTNKRPAAAVEVNPRVVLTLTRTTHPNPESRTLSSPANRALGLTKDGYWTDVNQRPIARTRLSDPKLCEYLGRLAADETDNLKGFWEITKALGRQGM